MLEIIPFVPLPINVRMLSAQLFNPTKYSTFIDFQSKVIT